MLALQRAAGNAATTRLIGGVRQSIARFGEPEHKGIGDAARNMRWRLPGSKLFKDLELTFGDWVALGDWFENIDDIRKIMRGEPLAGEDKVGARQARQVRQLPDHDRTALLRRAGEDPAEEPHRGQDGGGVRHGPPLLQGRQGRGRGALRAAEDPQHQALPEPARGRREPEHGGEGDAHKDGKPFGADRRVPRPAPRRDRPRDQRRASSASSGCSARRSRWTRSPATSSPTCSRPATRARRARASRRTGTRRCRASRTGW